MAAPLQVSIVLPTFNRMAWLPTAVESVRAQTLPDWELLIVDDGSTDETERWARRLAEPRIRYIRRAHTGSIAATRNAGMREARGAWIAFLDSDDRWRPDKLARQLARLCEVPSARWCYGKYQMIDTGGHPGRQPIGSPWHPFEGMFVDRILTTEAAVLSQTLVVDTALGRGCPFDERLPLAEDYDFVLRLAATAPGCVVDEVLAEIRIHPARTTTLAGAFDGYLGKMIAYRKAARTMADPSLRRIARRQLRSHTAEFLRRAVLHGAIGQIARVAVALGRS